jgi:hypothetical protein
MWSNDNLAKDIGGISSSKALMLKAKRGSSSVGDLNEEDEDEIQNAGAMGDASNENSEDSINGTSFTYMLL